MAEAPWSESSGIGGGSAAAAAASSSSAAATAAAASSIPIEREVNDLFSLVRSKPLLVRSCLASDDDDEESEEGGGGKSGNNNNSNDSNSNSNSNNSDAANFGSQHLLCAVFEGVALRAVVSGDDVLKLFTSTFLWSCVESELRGDEEGEGKEEEEEQRSTPPTTLTPRRKQLFRKRTKKGEAKNRLCRELLAVLNHLRA